MMLTKQTDTKKTVRITQTKGEGIDERAEALISLMTALLPQGEYEICVEIPKKNMY